MRVKAVIAKVESIRPSVKISLSMRRGLETLQKSIDDKVLLRLNERLRSTNVMSCAF